MKSYTEYTILFSGRGSTHTALEEKVREFLEAGWVCLGGVTFVSSAGWTQAMVK
jgi:anti-anti-sigma regulatory factor